MKRIKRIYIKGLSIDELKEILTEEYSNFVYEPQIKIKMIRYKEIEVYIDGEVASPGLYTLNGAKTTDNTIKQRNGAKTIDINNINNINNINQRNEDNKINENNGPFGFPKLSDLLKKAEGVTVNADLEEIIITRKYPISLGGGKVTAKINFLDVLNLKDMNQNLRILDGDMVFIPKSDEIVISQISKAIKSNINPKYINVYVLGRVKNPGLLNINKNSALSDAISVAGGTKTLRGKIQFIRNNNDGSIVDRKIRFKRNNIRGSKNNPYLRNGDVIYIDDSFFSKSSQVITELTSPLTGIINTYSIYKIISND